MEINQLSLFCRTNIIPQELTFYNEFGFMQKASERSYYLFGGKIPKLEEISYTDYHAKSAKIDKCELRLLTAVCNYLELLEKKNSAIPAIIKINHLNNKIEADSWVKYITLRYREVSNAKNLVFIKGGDPEMFSNLETSSEAIALLQKTFNTNLDRTMKW